MIPLVENQIKSNWSNAQIICARFNSTLVEILNWEKQMIVNSFLSQIWQNVSGINMTSFWLYGQMESDYTFTWIGSNVKMTYPNFINNHVDQNPKSDGLLMQLSKNDNFGKWINEPKSNASHYVICEYLMNIG
jgi:hypothetical protein